MAALRAAAQGLRGLLWPASGESSCGRETLSPAGAPSLSSFRGGCCVSQTENKSLSWRGGASAFLLLFLGGDRSRRTPPEPGFASAVNQGGQALLGLPPGRGELNAVRSWPRSEGPGGSCLPPPAPLGRGPRGSPATSARAPTLTHTHALALTPARSLGCGEGSPVRLVDQAAAVGSGVGSRAPALGGRRRGLSWSMGPGER